MDDKNNKRVSVRVEGGTEGVDEDGGVGGVAHVVVGEGDVELAVGHAAGVDEQTVEEVQFGGCLLLAVHGGFGGAPECDLDEALHGGGGGEGEGGGGGESEEDVVGVDVDPAGEYQGVGGGVGHDGDCD